MEAGFHHNSLTYGRKNTPLPRRWGARCPITGLDLHHGLQETGTRDGESCIGAQRVGQWAAAHRRSSRRNPCCSRVKGSPGCDQTVGRSGQ
ncbi:hypothetical protein SKAU_G00193540 [Synaphobranchus kaupii]|uniref:Uncharacterized protein n=1 Tax=Synaphobranchus kaupii TaxID=118154 RepID=A0A9Q1IXM9_SYNKA|nr:hypothetical protein SKAU_G00193540 [Synaphobranchus kaupii]